MDKRISNKKQVIGAYQVYFDGGREAGKRGVLVHNGALEVFFNASNALDILWIKYKGQNISYLGKSGLHAPTGDFMADFEGGFMYTCGMDNIGACVDGVYMHGTLHLRGAEQVNITENDEKIVVSGTVTDAKLFGRNLQLRRAYEVYANKIVVRDTVVNLAYTDGEYALLYHINFAYPFLDENLIINIPCKKVVAWQDAWADHPYDKFDAPTDNRPEEGYYLYPENGVELTNERLNITVRMDYDTEDFPVTWQWKSMASGDYVLGVEPATTTRNPFTMRKLAPQEQREYKIEITFA